MTTNVKEKERVMDSKPYNDLSKAPLSFVLLGLWVFPLFWVAVGKPGEELTTELMLWRVIPGVIVGGPIVVFGIWLKFKMARAMHGSR